MFFKCLFVLHIFASVAFAEQPQPFSNLNTMLAVEKDGNSIRFTAAGGQKTLNLANGAWSYVPSTTNISEPIDAWHKKGAQSKEIVPSWAPHLSPYYITTFPRGATKDSPWLLIEEGNEAGASVRQHLLDVLGKRSFLLPLDGYFDFAIAAGHAFLISPFGVSDLDLNTGSRIEYWTLPITNDIQGLVQNDGAIYYLTAHYGLFKVASPQNAISFAASFSPYIREGYRFSGLVSHEHKLYVLANKYGSYGKFWNYLSKDTECLLLAYDPKSERITEYKTGIEYSDNLKVSENWIYGWGHHIDMGDGGSTSYGGAFRFIATGQELEPLSYTPISKMETDLLTATSIIINEDTASATHLKYDTVKKRYVEDSTEDVVQQEIGWENFHKKEAEFNSKYREDNSAEIKRAMETLSRMKFSYTTMKFDVSPAQIETYTNSEMEKKSKPWKVKKNP